MIPLQMLLTSIRDNYQIVGTIDCNSYNNNFADLYIALQKLKQDSFSPNQRIMVTITADYYKQQHGVVLQSLQTIVNNVDISNCFILLVTTNANVRAEYKHIHDTYNFDDTFFDIEIIDGSYIKLSGDDIQAYTKNSGITQNIEQLTKLSQKQKDLLFNSKNFCIVPWISLQVGIDNKVAPCCNYSGEVGDASLDSLETIWNNKNNQKLRASMLEDRTVKECQQCIVEEQYNKTSLRQSINADFSHHVNRLKQGTTPDYKIAYFDSRFNNLCNLSCRICYHGSSSSWHAPAVAVGLLDKDTPVFLKAGRSKHDLYEQVNEQIDNIERMYFAGGEPLIMEDNYRILDELDRLGKHQVELIYNTNMTQSSLKGRSIFDVWKNFSNITVGASLDAEKTRAEYIRTGTKWDDVIKFRQQMLQKRPDINFFVCSTLSIINALHVPDFHRSWVDKDLIAPHQFKINTLHYPKWLAVETAPLYLKELIIEKYETHLDWLRPLDRQGLATNGFESVINQVQTDAEFDSKLFWKNIKPLDAFYKVNLLDDFPELVDLPQ
jgi:organic radical activating enzyme